MLHLDYGRCTLLSDCIKELLDEGFALEQVIAPFTSNVAKLLRLQKKGQIKVGNDADFVILDKDNNIESVMALGQWHQKNYKTIIHGCFEQQ